MKKYLLSVLSVMTMLTAASAQDSDLSVLTDAIYVESATIPAGSQQTLSVKMKNSIEVQTIQFDLYLPEGVTFVANEDGDLMTASKERINKFNYFDSAIQSDGALRLLAQATTTNIPVGDGEIAKVTVSADAGMAQGDYPMAVKAILIVSKDNTSKEVDEVITTLTIGSPADTRTILNETSTTAPEAATGVDVRVKRTIKAGQWSTICLPFPITTEQMATAFGEDVEVQLADFTGYVPEEDEEGDIVAIRVSFSTVTGMEANHPYIIRVNKDVTEINVDNVDIDPEEEPTHATIKRTRRQWSEIIGTYVAEFEVPEKTLFLSGNKFYYSTGLTKMKAFRAYFDFYDVLTSVDEAGAKFSMSFDPTGIDGLPLNVIIKGAVYTVGGQLVGKDVDERQLPRGVYIRDGKKFVVK